MNKSLILVVEDDTSVRNLITTTLKAHEYRYLTAPDGQSAILETSSHNPDIVLLDLGLPDIDGVEIIKKIRTWSNMPIIVISARSEDTDKIDALDAGADDYLTKPFSVEELLARLRVTQRRLSMMQKVSPAEAVVFVNGKLRVDYAAGCAYLNEEELHLTPIEYKLLCLLTRNIGKVLTHTFLTQSIWGSSWDNDIASLRVFMATLRKKIEKEPNSPHANSKKYIRPKRGKRNYNPFYYCGVCGRALAPSKRVKGDILLCSSSRIEKNSPCKSNRVEIAKVEDAIMKIVNMYATAYLDEKGIKKAGKSKEVSPEEKIATLEKKVKSLSSKKMMLYSDYKDDKLTREEYVKRSKAMVEQIDELHQEIEQLKTEIPPEDNSSSKFETQLESIINMESFDREKIQKVIKKVIINGEDNIEIVWNTDDPFFK